MWFKGLLFLSYTAFLIDPIKAVVRSQDEVVPNKEEHSPVQGRTLPHLDGRQQPWMNHTRSPEPEEKETIVTEPIASPIVSISTFDDAQATSAQKPEESSAIITDGSSSSSAPSSSHLVPEATSAPSEAPGESSNVVPSSHITSGAEQPPSSSRQEEPLESSHVASFTTLEADVTSEQLSSMSATPTSKVMSEPISGTDNREPLAPTRSELPDPEISNQPSSAATPPKGSTIVTSSTSDFIEPQPSSTVVPTSNVEQELTLAPESETSSIAQEPSPTLIQLSSPSSNTIPTTSSDPTASSIGPSHLPKESTTAERRPSEGSETPLVPSQIKEETSVASTSLQGLPLTSDLGSILSSVISQAGSAVSSALIPSNAIPAPSIPTPTGEPAQTDPKVPQSTVQPTRAVSLPISALASVGDQISSQLSSVLSEVDRIPSVISSVQEIPSGGSSAVSSLLSNVESVVVPSTTSSLLSSVLSDVASSATGSPLNPTSQVDSTLRSTASSFPSPSQTNILISTSLIFSDGIAVSETLTIPNDSTIPPTPTSGLNTITTGITLPGFSGTGVVSEQSDILVTSSSVVATSQVNPTGSDESGSDTSGFSVLSPSATSSGVSELSVAFSLFTPSSDSPSSNQAELPSPNSSDSLALATSRFTQIPASETLATPTITPVTGSSSPTLLPAPGSTSGISGSTNASLVGTSNIGISFTASSTGVTTGASPTLFDTLETSSKAKLSVPASETKLITETSVTDSSASQSGVSSPTGSSVDSVGPSDTSTAISGATKIPTGNTIFNPTQTARTGFIGSTTEPIPSPTTDVATAGAGASTPPLTKSQTAGIAVGGTTCLLIAIVAALFLARRYHANAVAKRQSGGSVYPEVAYLYDPPVGGNGDAEAGGAVPAMSGGASGYPAGSNTSLGSAQGYGPAPHNSPQPSPRHSTGSTPQNPFRDHSGPSEGNGTVSAIAAGGVAGFAAAAAALKSQRDSRDGAPQNPFRDPVIPSPEPSPRLGGYGGPVGDSRGDYAQLAINPYAYNPAASEYPIMSPYAPVINRDLTSMKNRESEHESERYSDPFADDHDPFEHDLLLNVDMRTETPDSITVYAPPPTPRSPLVAHFPGRYTVENTSSHSLIPPPTSTQPPNGRYSPPNHSSNTSYISRRWDSPMGRSTPVNSSLNSSPTLGGQSSFHNSPIIAPARAVSPAPIHKGWDEIKTDDSVLVPAPLTPTMKKKPLPPRIQPPLAGPGQLLLSGPGLPLTVKRKQVGGGSGNLEIPKSLYGSPGPTINEFSQDPTVQRKRSGEQLFADPQLMGRPYI